MQFLFVTLDSTATNLYHLFSYITSNLVILFHGAHFRTAKKWMSQLLYKLPSNFSLITLEPISLIMYKYKRVKYYQKYILRMWSTQYNFHVHDGKIWQEGLKEVDPYVFWAIQILLSRPNCSAVFSENDKRTRDPTKMSRLQCSCMKP